MTEILITVGVQYIGDQLGPGVMKALNATRCMFNNAGTNMWSFFAGTW